MTPVNSRSWPAIRSLLLSPTREPHHNASITDAIALIFRDENDISVSHKGKQERQIEGGMKTLLPSERIERAILLIRGHTVMLDMDLAHLYGVTTKRLNEQVKRNQARFHADFVLQLTVKEVQSMRSQIATASKRNVRYLPFAFTEHGALMAASVLNTARAIDVSVYVIRAFVRLRELLSTHKELAHKLAELERKVSSHDESIQSLVTAIRRLTQPPSTASRPRIGFHVTPECKS